MKYFLIGLFVVITVGLFMVAPEAMAGVYGELFKIAIFIVIFSVGLAIIIGVIQLIGLIIAGTFKGLWSIFEAIIAAFMR